jgi:prepilin-type N-terminal cleavage/methylation domain-containing protein
MLMGNIKNFKAFTLVELLVVIAIVGLLSTIILVSTSGLREQAEITRTLVWARGVDSTLGASAVGIWNMDEGIENTCFDGKDVCDISGWNNNGILNGATYTTDTPSNQGYALIFDEEGDYVEISDDDSLDPTAGITVAAWVYLSINPDTTADNDYRVVVSGKGSEYNPYGILIEQTRRVCVNVYVGGVRYTTGQDYYLPVGEWIFLTYTYNSTDGKIKFYANGKQEDEYTISGGGNINIRDGSVRISWPVILAHRFFPGLIDEVRIYDAVLTADQIQSRYYADLDRLLAKGLMGKQEYQKLLAAK